jgi:hypothetical protein
VRSSSGGGRPDEKLTEKKNLDNEFNNGNLLHEENIDGEEVADKEEEELISRTPGRRSSPTSRTGASIV